MSYIFLLEQGEEFSADTFSDIPVPVLSRSTSIAGEYSCNVSVTASCHDSQSGTISVPLTAHPGEDELTSCAVDFPVRTFPRLAKGLESLASEAGSGAKWQELCVKYDRNTSSWKTHRCLFQEDLDWCSLTLPKWGLMRHGELYRRKTPHSLEALRQSITNGSDSGCSQKVPTLHGFSKDGKSNGPSGNELGRAVNQMMKAPTPKASDGERGGRGDLIQMVRGNQNKHFKITSPRASRRGVTVDENPRRKKTGGCKSLESDVASMGHSGPLNPPWVEWLMGWPIGWTDCDPLEMDKFQLWQRSHLGCYMTRLDVDNASDMNDDGK